MVDADETIEFQNDSFGLKTLQRTNRWIDIRLNDYRHRDYVSDRVDEFYYLYLRKWFVEPEEIPSACPQWCEGSSTFIWSLS